MSLLQQQDQVVKAFEYITTMILISNAIQFDPPNQNEVRENVSFNNTSTRIR